MRQIPKINNTKILAFTSQLLGKTRIINLPENTDYGLQDTLNVVLHAATSTTNSIESASMDLRMNIPNKKIPSADTVHNYINYNSIDYILSSFGQITNEIIQLSNLEGTSQDGAVDFHDISYYGDKNTPGIRGIKPKSGTSWGYSFCTLDIIGETKLTLDVRYINGLKKDYSILIKSMIENANARKIKIKRLLMDREFFNSQTISALHDLPQEYIIAAKSNKKINAILLEHKKKFGDTSTVFEYQFENSPKFNLVAIYNKYYDPKKKDDKGNHEFYLFATNIEIKIASDILKMIPEEYRKRWNIETGYRLKNAFKIRTCSKSPVVRTLFFIVQCLLYNIESLLKQVIEIDAYKLKSAISDAIANVIKAGYKSLFIFSAKNFMNSLRDFARIRTFELIEGLKGT